MSALLNFGPPSQPAPSSARLQIMIDEKRSKKSGQVEDRVAEGLLRRRIAVGGIDAQGMGDEHSAERNRGGQVSGAAHADDIGKKADREEDDGIEQDLQPRGRLGMRERGD